MKKRLTRVLSLLLCLLLCVGMFPVAGAEEVYTEEEPADVFEQFDPEYTEAPAVAENLEETADLTEEPEPMADAEPVEADSAETAEPADITEPAAADPVEDAEPTAVPDPESSAVPVESTETVEIIEPAAAMEETEDIAEPAEGVEPAEAAESTDAVEPADVTEVTDAAEPAELIEVEEDSAEPQPAEAVLLEPEAEEPAAAGNPEAEAQDGQEQAAEEAVTEEAEPAEPETEQLAIELVKVVFKPVPQDATIAVYAEGGSGERSLIQAEEDGSYLLVPGEYSYDVSAEGCLSVERIPLLVVASEEPVEISLALTAMENSEVTEAPDPEADGEVPVDERVQVVFRLSPENAAVEVQVYTKDDKGGQQKVEPEADGSYLLAPGTYFYRCHDDTGAFADLGETELRIETATQNPLTVELTMIPLQKVVFRSEETNDLSGLTVLDREGKVIEPTGEAGTYRLVPGIYSYRYHDESGNFKDIEDTAFALDASQNEVNIPLVLEIAWRYFRYINPLYRNIVREEEFPEFFFPNTNTSGRQHASEAPAMMSVSGVVHTSVSSAAKEVRASLVERKSVAIYYRTPHQLQTTEQELQLMYDILYAAVAHSGAPQEGDYLMLQYESCYGACGFECTSDFYVVEFQPRFFTTAEQENEMTSKVNSILNSLNLSGKSDYQKILAIYSYLTKNVKYDNENLNNPSYKLKYSAYAALVNGTAVCQGYAAAFYRLCLEAGINARVVISDTNERLVHSDGEIHTWNIVHLVDKYFEMDATWDAGKSSGFQYFLRGSSYWQQNHGNGHLGYLGGGVRTATTECSTKYPISQTDYNAAQETKPTITTHPSSVSLNDEGTVTFKVAATGGGLSYQWQVRTSSSGSWVNSKANGYNTATCKPNVKYSNNGYQYRCRVVNSAGTVYSNTATVTIKKVTPTITTQPASANVNERTAVTFKVAAKGGELSYQWQVYSTANESWVNSGISSAKTSTLKFTSNISQNGMKYRCKVSNSVGAVYSGTATLTVKRVAPTITTQPTSAGVNEGATAKFKVAAIGSALSYQWQVYSVSAGKWINSGISSAKTSTLSFVTNAGHNGLKYRCRVSNPAGTVYSGTATLTVKTMPDILTQPESVTVTHGKTASFSIEAIGGGLSYQWQVFNGSTGNWVNSGISSAKTSTLSFVTNTSQNGLKYRCRVSNSVGTVYSIIVTLIVK